MPDWTKPIEGGCRCGRVRVRVTAPPLLTSACHCPGCQRMTASGFSLSIAIPDEGFAVIAGTTELGGLQGAAKHHFCGWCKSWMFSKVEGLGPFVNLRAPVLDDRSWFVPYVEMWVSTRLPGIETGAPRAYPEFPAMEEFPALLAGYRAWAGLPA
jgi:hypothetical protein